MHSELGDPESVDADDRKNDERFFGAGFLFVLYILKDEFHRQDPIDDQSHAKAERRGNNERKRTADDPGRQQPLIK